MQSSSRNGATVRLLAIHTTEGILKVNDLRNWKTWAGSSHATADQYGGFLDGPADGFVAYDRAAWTLRSGNPISDNIELCGFAKWSRSDWLARPKLIESAALWLARRKKARPHIPLVKLTPEQVRAGQAGVIGHNDWTVGMKDGSHWDPGPGFPWDVVLTRAQQLYSNTPGNPTDALPEDDMFTDADRALLTDIKGQLTGSGDPGKFPGLPDLGGRTVVQHLRDLPTLVATTGIPRNDGDITRSLIDEMRQARFDIAGHGQVTIDPQQLAAAVRPLLEEAVRAGRAASDEAQAKAVVDQLAARLAGS